MNVTQFAKGRHRIIQSQLRNFQIWEVTIQNIVNEGTVVKKGDWVYLGSDGFQDQFGGLRGKKFGSSKLHVLLKTVSKYDGGQQKIFLKDHLETWSAKREQTDDICLMGIQFGAMVGMNMEMLPLHNQGKKRESVSRVMVLKRNHQKLATGSGESIIEQKQLKRSVSIEFGDYRATSGDFNVREQGCSPDIRVSYDRAVFL